jgi:coproporphyrinogen III oxidase
MHKTATKEFRGEWIDFVHHLQEIICKKLEEADGKALFNSDKWQRAAGKGGGGLTKVIEHGDVFEKGGVNTSVVYGKVTENMKKHMILNGIKWFACGISIVLHPVNPWIPTVHCNYRMFELYDENDELSDRWFGGGTDLTPYYLVESDARHFHETYKRVCDQFDPTFYPEFKQNCDNYFINTHRNNECRGIGGIFYDHQRPDEKHDSTFWMNFGKACGNAFLPAYLPLVEDNKRKNFNEKQKYWQEIRRGRYTEFNLIHDRGTLFGLKTNGRTESILMSLPPTVRFEYNYQPSPGSEEEKLLQVCLSPREWT